MKNERETASEVEQVTKVIERLLDPDGGCPWDLKQNHNTLIPYLIEESYEFIHEVEKNNDEGMKDELGDILLQILLHSRIAAKEGRFDIEAVAKNLKEKMIYRHPHVFGDKQGEDIDSDQVLKNWGELKEKEKKKNSTKDQQKKAIPDSYLKLPALMSSFKIGKKTNFLEFDWNSPEMVLEKVEEELLELKNELNHKHKEMNRVKEELGDLMFSIAQLARHLDLNPEETLRDANFKFTKRFEKLNLLLAKERGEEISIKDLSFDEKLKYWEKVKAQEKHS